MLLCSQTNPCTIDISIVISALSLLIACLAFLVNQKNSTLNSYAQKACYQVFFVKRNFLELFLNKYRFNIKIYPSIMSEVIPFNYTLRIRPYIGGIYRTQLFTSFDDDFSLGTAKTGPILFETMPSKISLKKYANTSDHQLSTNVLFPYAYAVGKYDEKTRKSDNQLNRYHSYIEITDYCGNTEIWYMSFSLLLSNKKDTQYKWLKCTFYDGYDYYTYNNIAIVSPKDVLKNYNRTLKFNKSIDQIIGKTNNSLESKSLIENGFAKMEYDFQLYEMKEYINFLKKLKTDIFI